MVSPRPILERRHWKRIAHKRYRYQTVQPMQWSLGVKILPEGRSSAQVGPIGNWVLKVRRESDGDQIVIDAGYAWDGASGVAIDTPSFMRASLIHDGLYQLIRIGALPKSCRRRADLAMLLAALEDGMHPARGFYCWSAVRALGWSAV